VAERQAERYLKVPRFRDRTYSSRLQAILHSRYSQDFPRWDDGGRSRNIVSDKRRIFARTFAVLRRRRGIICSFGRQTAEVSCIRFGLAARPPGPACAH
jgi:hypothetical protein